MSVTSAFNKLKKLRDPEIRDKNLRHAGYLARQGWYRLTRPEMPDPVFIVGCSRSGTTVTFETLAASGRFLHFGHELPEFWDSLHGPADNGWASEAAGAADARPEHRTRAFAHFYARLGVGQVLDKTCINCLRIPYLHALFPRARFVYIRRDGRDNVSSLMDGWRKETHFGLRGFLGEFPEPVAIDGGRFDEWRFFLPPGWRDYNRASLARVCAYQWVTANRLALEAAREIPADRWIAIRYEDIFVRPVEMFREVFERLQVPFTEALEERCASLHRRPTSIVKGAPAPAKWRGENAEAVASVVDDLRPMMERLGYPLD